MLGDKDGAHEDIVALILREADACPEDARANRISTLESCAHTDAGNIDPLEKNDNTERYQANVVQKNTFFGRVSCNCGDRLPKADKLQMMSRMAAHRAQCVERNHARAHGCDALHTSLVTDVTRTLCVACWPRRLPISPTHLVFPSNVVHGSPPVVFG